MSDEFIEIATKEINDEILKIQKIVNSCHNSNDVFENVVIIQQSTHKIKGLAPMMGKTTLGNLAVSLDALFKKIFNDSIPDDLFESLVAVVIEMKNSMDNSDYNLDKILQRISKMSSANK
jgi:chemotaxis protein histidine kinase CheA